MAGIPDIVIGSDLSACALRSLTIQLIRIGVLTGRDINEMARRSNEQDAATFRAIFLEAMLDDSPEAMRSGMHVVAEGGNEPD